MLRPVLEYWDSAAIAYFKFIYDYFANEIEKGAPSIKFRKAIYV